MSPFHTRSRGFTLIELMVAISIVVVLSSIVLANVRNARAKGNDTARTSNLKQIQIALEAYFEAYGVYPNTTQSGSTWWNSQCITDPSWGKQVTANNVIPGLVPNYLDRFPTDPKMIVASNTCCYLYRSDGANYKLIAGYQCQIVETNFLAQKDVIDPGRDSSPGNCTQETTGAGVIHAWAAFSAGACSW